MLHPELRYTGTHDQEQVAVAAKLHVVALDELELCAEDVRLYESQVNGQDIGIGGWGTVEHATVAA